MKVVNMCQICSCWVRNNVDSGGCRSQWHWTWEIILDGFAAGSFRDGSEGSNRQRKFAIINEGTVFWCRDEMFIIPESTSASNAMELLSRPMGFGV